MTSTLRCAFLLMLICGAGLNRPGRLAASVADDTAALTAMVRSDWEAQETRLGRTPQSREAIEAALERTSRLLNDLTAWQRPIDLSAEAAELQRFILDARQWDSINDEDRVDLYFQIRTLTRQLALKNPLVGTHPIVFMQRNRAVGYMLYEYLGWYYAYGYDPTNGAKDARFATPRTGGGVYVLDRPGHSLATRELTAGDLPPGHFVTLALSHDAQTIYFAYADPSGEDPYDSPGFVQAPAEPGTRYNSFHLYAMNADGTQLRQLTEGPNDDFDPCPLPDGSLAFESTRRGSKLRCGGGSPELVYTLHRMEGDGRNVRTLSFHETHEWHPSLLNDGRIIYTRWDYVDRNAAKFHGLWTCNQDGSNPSSLFGNYTTRPWACYQAKPIPGSNQIVFVAGGHHANVGGTLMRLDPARIALDSEQGVDRFEALTCLTPDVCFAEAEGWPKSYFYSPWPLSEQYFLVAFSHDPLPGGYTGEYRDTETGIYYFDTFGNLELLYRKPGISAVYPVPLTSRPAPPVPLNSAVAGMPPEGEFLLADVRKSLLPLPADRRIAQLRIFQVLPKSRTDHASVPRIGHPDQSNARMLLGTVPVEEDGSAYFRAPANKPLFFQAVDDSGRAVQGMRTVVYLQPGERRGCVGCHEPPGTAPDARLLAATLRPPSVIEPGADGTRPFGYPRLIQPLLDQHCTRCHDGAAGPDKSELVLTGSPTDSFSRSYDNLLPYLRWPSPDGVTKPGELGADTSPLSAIVTGDPHRVHVELPDAPLRTLYLWLDAHVPFFGTYEEDDLQRQRLGQAVPAPELQ
ncbi:MAG: HzsA-related protein [Pirellulaceae bacterium]